MSEPQIPAEIKETEVSAASSTSDDAETEQATQPPVCDKNTSTLKLPDWKPLGNVRDYFTEQMRQDSIFRY